jgi:hypothetical protein
MEQVDRIGTNNGASRKGISGRKETHGSHGDPLIQEIFVRGSG